MKRILIVDDELGLVEVLSDVLSDEGYEVVTAADGRRGYARLQESVPALVLLDFMMPVESGPQLFRRMRASAELREVPVVMMSSVDEDVVRAECPGLAGFLSKPFLLETLLEVVQRVVPVEH